MSTRHQTPTKNLKLARADRVNHANGSTVHGSVDSCAIRAIMVGSVRRQEFGLLRNRPDASLLLRARWIAQTRRRFGAANTLLHLTPALSSLTRSCVGIERGFALIGAGNLAADQGGRELVVRCASSFDG
jgi:hypothetical protein